MYWFTADEHYGHAKVIEYCNRPFISVEEMNEALIANFNSVVTGVDVTVHVGDFCWAKNRTQAAAYYSRLNGTHIFVKGSHDGWLPNSMSKFMWRAEIDGQFVVACHYALRTWERARYGSWQVYGHSHGKLPPIGKQYDVGVDCNFFTPVSFGCLKQLMTTKEVLHEQDSGDR